jgi:hypothetical protein
MAIRRVSCICSLQVLVAQLNLTLLASSSSFGKRFPPGACRGEILVYIDISRKGWTLVLTDDKTSLLAMKVVG